jgi:hypothetical protein
MSEEYVKGIDEQHAPRSVEHALAREHQTGGPGESAAELSGSASLLRAAGHSGRGNRSVRATSIQSMQHVHGNRAVQRFLQRTFLPVQRGDEDEQKLPSFRPWLPELGLPFGGGWGFKGEGKGVGIDYKGGSGSGGIGYDYGGGFSAEGGYKFPWGKSSLGLEFDPWKKEGSAGLKFGDLWLKGKYGEKGWGIGGGWGSPPINPEGLPANPGDPSKDWRKGEVGPGMFGPPSDIEKQKKGWGFGFGFGKDDSPLPNNPGGLGWWGFGGIQGNW